MDKIELQLNYIEKSILSIDYSVPKNFVEEIMQKQKNDLLLRMEIQSIVNKAFEMATH